MPAGQPPAPRPAAGEGRAGEPLRLLVLAPFFPPHVGGLESYASDLDEALLAGGEAAVVTVLTPRLPAEAADEEQLAAGHRVVRYPAFELIPNFPVPKLWRRALWRAVRSASPRSHHILVTHTRFFLTSVLALPLRRWARLPVLHIEHGSDFVQLSGRAPRAAARLFDLSLGRALLRRSDAVIAISQAAADFVRRLSGREATVIPRGVRAAEIQGTAEDRGLLAWAGGRPVVAFIGRLIDGKGVPDLLRAFATALGADRAVLCIVGDGPRRLELEGLARELGLGERARFLGYLPEREAWAATRSSDIVVNPSYTEGLPTSVLEGALLGKAVLATDVGGTSEIVSADRSALLFAPRDEKALREGLERLLADPGLRERLGAAAREESVGRFDWQLAASRFAAVAHSLLEPPQLAGSGVPPSTPANTDS